jgi:hypothetical protein
VAFKHSGCPKLRCCVHSPFNCLMRVHVELDHVHSNLRHFNICFPVMVSSIKLDFQLLFWCSQFGQRQLDPSSVHVKFIFQTLTHHCLPAFPCFRLFMAINVVTLSAHLTSANLFHACLLVRISCWSIVQLHIEHNGARLFNCALSTMELLRWRMK